MRNNLPILSLVVTFLFCFNRVHSLNNGVGRLPAMGYNSWYDLMGELTETSLKATVDAMVELKLPEFGYNYFNLDDDWAIGRDIGPGGLGTLIADPSRFVGGTLTSLANYVHMAGMKFGTYTDRGNLTCGGRPGAFNHEKLDAQTYANWGVDYLKEDSCYVDGSDQDLAFVEYSKMRDALNATGRPILFSLCGWYPWYATVGALLGNSWRIGPDDTDWNGVLTNININSQLSQYAGAGGFNDPCLLLSNDYNSNLRITERQTRFQFSMWAIMTSPLLISGNIRNMTVMNIETYTNVNVIAINQDSDARQGIRVAGGNLTAFNATSLSGGGTNIWSKQLSDGAIALAFVNTKPTVENISCDIRCWEAAFGGERPQSACMFNAWTGKSGCHETKSGFIALNVESEGGVEMLRVTPQY